LAASRVLAAGMAAQSVQLLSSAGVVVALDRAVWDTSWFLSGKSLLGKLLHTLIGYGEWPTEMQLMAYIATLFMMFLLMRLARYVAKRAPGPRRIAAQRLPPNAAKAASGALSISFSNARAGPRGERFPCSQLRTVSIGTSIFFAKAACVSPQRVRTWRTNEAGSL
jgi:hypothetical protein